MRAFKAAFPKDFQGNIRGWQAKVKEAEDDMRRKNSAEDEENPAGVYLLNDKGNMLANVANAITMMGVLPLRWISFSCRTFLTADSPWGDAGNWTDNDDVSGQEWCQRQGLNISYPGTIGNAAEKIARQRPYHPVGEYLDGLEWDAVPRLDFWLTKYLGAGNNQYIKNVASKWMIQAVQRVSEPGCQADYTLVLEGSQGRRKSTAMRVLAGSDWFSDDVTDIGSKDSAMQLQGKWIVELAEFDPLRKLEMTTIKAWLVRRVDHFRPPYGRRPDDFPRQNVFVATTNKDDWGNDDTGLRRFWPVRVGGKIDIDGLAAKQGSTLGRSVSPLQRGRKVVSLGAHGNRCC